MSNDYWPSEAEYTPGLLKEDWIHILQNPSICYEDCLHILACFYAYGGEGTCLEIEIKYQDTRNTYKYKMNSLGKRIIDAKLCNNPKSIGVNRTTQWSVLFVGKEVETEETGSYVWKLRPELMEALKEVDIQQWLEIKPFNDELLNYYKAEYKKEFKKYFWKENNTNNTEEGYKWKAVKCFQNYWDINANDFEEMIKLAFAESGNLLSSGGNLALAMLINYAKASPEELRNAFNNLFDENKPIVERMEKFQKDTYTMNTKYGTEKWKNTYQTPNTISTYLWLRYPEKYFIFKIGLLNDATTMLDAFYEPEEKSFQTVEGAFQFCEMLRNELRSDKELIALEKECLTSECYSDETGNILTIDFIHYLSAYAKKNWLIPASPKDYNIDLAYEKYPKINWKQSRSFSVGDIIYIYVSSPQKRVSYKAIVTRVNVPGTDLIDDHDCEIDDSGYADFSKMEIEFLGKSDDVGLIYATLKKHGLKSHIQSAEIVKPKLLPYLNKFFTEGENKIMNNIPEKIIEYTNLLENKKNLILQGAPGTGKTYMTAALALSVIGVKDIDYSNREAIMKKYDELQKAGQIKFCTFHQSLDYEDFVEGLRPEGENDGITYNPKSGIFKRICLLAKENLENYGKTKEEASISNSWRIVLKDFIEPQVDLPTEKKKSFEKANGGKFYIEDVVDEAIIVSIPENEKVKKLRIRINEIIELLEKEVSLETVGAIHEHFGMKFRRQEDSYVYTLVNELRKIQKKDVELIEKEPLKKYVLIIDEINRGYVSKIFGELITLLEADKRLGEINAIKLELPYSGDLFGVPKNLYIIGTMNTTDRSTGTIDYAIRRRFAFVTLSADITKLKEISENTKDLFFDVKSFIETRKVEDFDIGDLMVGQSYFMAKNESELKQKMCYEVIPLIKEYIKDGILNCLPDEANPYFDAWKNLTVYSENEEVTGENEE